MSGPGEPPPPLRWTRLTYLSVGAGTALLLAGVVLHASTPVFVGLPFLIAPLAAAVTGPRRALRADLAWRAGGQEGTVTIDGLIRGDRAGALADLDLTFDRPGNLDEERPPQFGRSADGVGFRLHWRAPFPTLAVVEPPTIVWRDPVGFVERPTEGVRAALVIDRFPPELVRLGR